MGEWLGYNRGLGIKIKKTLNKTITPTVLLIQGEDSREWKAMTKGIKVTCTKPVSISKRSTATSQQRSRTAYLYCKRLGYDHQVGNWRFKPFERNF